MTLGSGAYHSEQNGSETEPLHFIQMWIMPEARGLSPSVEQKVFTKQDRTNRLLEVIGPEGREGVVKVHRDAFVYVSHLDTDSAVQQELASGFGAYFFLIEGEVDLNGERLKTGDAARIWDEERLTINARQPSELIVVRVEV
jgi:redox-sensitive bicupin YhaK (pirin superfamily)